MLDPSESDLHVPVMHMVAVAESSDQLRVVLWPGTSCTQLSVLAARPNTQAEGKRGWERLGLTHLACRLTAMLREALHLTQTTRPVVTSNH